MAGGLQISLYSLRIRREETLKSECALVQYQAHGGVVFACCFVKIDVQAVVGLYLQGSLYSSRGEGMWGPVSLLRFRHPSPDFTQPGFLGYIFL